MAHTTASIPPIPSIDTKQSVNISFPNTIIPASNIRALLFNPQRTQMSSSAASEITRGTRRRRKKSKRLFLISLSLATFSLGCFLSIHLLWGYKALLPWKCKRLCWYWPGWEWWKRLEDGPLTAVLVSGPAPSCSSRLTDSHSIESERRRAGALRLLWTHQWAQT